NPRSRLSFVLGSFLVGVFVVCALLAPLLPASIGYDPYAQVAPRSVSPPTPPSRDNWLGTDTLGRDLLSRLVFGARISLEVGVLATAIALLIGPALGAAAGGDGARVVPRHRLPKALRPLIVVATLGIGGNILMEAWLSFLGVGARPPLPSWGTMITEGQEYFLAKPWVCLAPGLAILLVVLGFNLLGDAIGDRLDPRRGQRVV